MKYNSWPIGHIPKELQRPEIDQLKKAGYGFDNPWEIIDIFEKKVAEFAGSKYAIATDCCTHAIFLSLIYYKEKKMFGGTHDPSIIKIPKYTYFSIPMIIQQAGFAFEFINNTWEGGYWLYPTEIWDGAVRWEKGMYNGGFHCLSFQIKKNIPIGRGGMILLNDFEAYEELKLMRYDGRDMNIDRNDKDHIKRLGYHVYMTPEDAARGILLMDKIGDMPDSYTWKDYQDLTKLNLNE